MRYLLILLCVLSLSVSAETSLLNTTKQAKQSEQKANQQREKAFKSTEQALKAKKAQLLKEQAQLQNSIDALSEQFTENELKLAEAEKTLHLESGSLGELFGVVRQVSKELQLSLAHSLLVIDQKDNLQLLDEIVAAQELPSKQQLYGLWKTLLKQLENGSTATTVKVPFVQADGVITEKTVLRLGAFALADEHGYLQWSGHNMGAKPYSMQPTGAVNNQTPLNNQQLYNLDPSQGQLLQQFTLKPTLMQRFQQGGGVGKVILGILILGLLIGLVQGVFLVTSRTKINRQLKDKNAVGNNALGRILGVYKYDNSPNVEALELRLYEAILDEQQKLERGLPMLKLLAALAPMLGLLGTVTGMIQTFQVITEYGNADPKVMAGGISMALVTTVLGLVAAMPLLFLHNILSSQATSIRTVLEKQGVGLVAERAEQETV